MLYNLFWSTIEQRPITKDDIGKRVIVAFKSPKFPGETTQDETIHFISGSVSNSKLLGLMISTCGQRSIYLTNHKNCIVEYAFL